MDSVELEKHSQVAMAVVVVVVLAVVVAACTCNINKHTQLCMFCCLHVPECVCVCV